jgi:cyclic-di-AMP phosphodiesterase PgpH
MSIYASRGDGIRNWPTWVRQNWRLLAVTLGLFLAFTLTLTLEFSPGSQVEVTLGERAAQEIFSPIDHTYVSIVQTNQLREQAALAVPDVYTASDLAVGRAQNLKAQAVFAFVEVVRADPLADRNTKIRYLQAIEQLVIEQQVADDLLSLGQADYNTAKTAVLAIVGEIMLEPVREGEESEARRAARGRVNFNWTAAQERIVTTLSPQFIVANSFRNEEATGMLRAEAAAAVAPVQRTFTQGESIIRVGRVVEEADIEMLEELGLLQAATDWWALAATTIISFLGVTLVVIYWHQFYNHTHESPRQLFIFAGLLVVAVIGMRLMLSAGGLFAYLFPMAGLSLLLAALFDARLSLFVTIVLASLAGHLMDNSLEFTMYTAVGGLVAVLTLRDTQRLSAIFRAGLAAATGNTVVILLFHLSGDPVWLDFFGLLLMGLVNGLISASLTLAGFFLLGSLFGMLTSLQLQDLARLDHPLLQELLRRAPGTYHHSIMVANLAEQAAERIKANSALVRVGAFYHDVGKMNRPPFFVENQEGGNSPHDSLDPFSSARIIISHVSDGLQLARRYRLPTRLHDFIAEHHGDRVLKTFYQKAREQAVDADEVDVNRFRHKGPRPRSRETGIVQLADAIEATSSALRPNTEAAIEKLVTGLVDEHLKEGQLDQSGLTLGDIRRLRESFIETLKGRFHMRVLYPGNEELMVQPPAPAAASSEDGRGAAASEFATRQEEARPGVIVLQDAESSR